MTVQTLDGKSLCEQLADNYKRTLPKRGKGTAWTMDSFSTWVSLRYPHVKVVVGQVWSNANATYKFMCEDHGWYETQARRVLLASTGCQCKGCRNASNTKLAGIKRNKRLTKDQKSQIEGLRSEGLSYEKIAAIVGCSNGGAWFVLNQEGQERRRSKSLTWKRNNLDRSRANSSRWSTEYQHGKESRRKTKNTRRGLEYNAVFDVLVDDQLVEVNMRNPQWYKDLHDKNLTSTNEDSQVFVDEESTKVYAQMVQQCKEMEDYFGFPFEVDHLIPLAAGGEHIKENFEIKPMSENRSKGDERNVDDEAQFCKNLFNIK
jgi:hypothetical protein